MLQDRINENQSEGLRPLTPAQVANDLLHARDIRVHARYPPELLKRAWKERAAEIEARRAGR